MLYRPFPTVKLDARLVKSVQCGTLSSVVRREVSDELTTTLITGVYCDLATDYPYSRAIGGKSRAFFSFFLPILLSNICNNYPDLVTSSLTNILIPPQEQSAFSPKFTLAFYTSAKFE